MNTDELQEILRLHSMWLRGEDGGARANLRGVNLRLAGLSGADLSGANLSGANLRWANLRWANLRWADLGWANLSGANLREASLSGANLRGANLRWANLRWANLGWANLREASIREASLCGADLSGAIDGSVCRMDFGGWSICIRATETSIGCQRHANDRWLAWSPDDVAFMHENARRWWSVHGEAIKAVIRCVMEKAAKQKEAT